MENMPIKSFCDKVPLLIQSAIQPHGAIIVVSKKDLNIIQVSGNIKDILGLDPCNLLNTSFNSLLLKEQQILLQNQLNDSLPCSKPLALNLKHKSAENICWMYIQPQENYYIFELEPQDVINDHDFTTIIDKIETCLAEIRLATTLSSLCEKVAKIFKRIAHYDKVMVYQFDMDWSGLVIAEEKEAAMESYLGLKFPATDIPKPVRDFYLVNQYRYIPTINYQPIGLLPSLNFISQKITDITFCYLRTVAPVHIEYLQNMQITATASYALIVQGKLWGLIACHHRTPKYLTTELRMLLKSITETISLQLTMLIEKNDHELKTSMLHTELRLTELMFEASCKGQHLLKGLVQAQSPNLLNLFNAGGALIAFQNKYHILGVTPSRKAMKDLLEWLAATMQEAIFITDKLPALFEASKAYEAICSGLVAIRIGEKVFDYILLFRPALIQTINWAGNPHKTIYFEKDSTQYHPRHSFEIWKETVKGCAKPWHANEIETVKRFASRINEYLLIR